MCVVSKTLECPDGSLNLQFPPTPWHLSNAVTSKPRSEKFFIAVIPQGPAPIIATLFITYVLFLEDQRRNTLLHLYFLPPSYL